jgi:uncharacterized membrane protein
MGLLALMVLGTIFVYPKLPAHLPVHWNIEGRADHYIAKSPISAFMIPGIIIAIYGLLLTLPIIDPKKNRYFLFAKSYLFIRYLLLCFLVVIYAIVTAQSLGIPLRLEKIVPAGTALLLIGIGNVMGKVKQNWFIGFKFPWTMSDEVNWNKTHRFGGKVFVVAGILGLIGLLLPSEWTVVFLIVPLIAGIITIGIYSYLLYVRKNPGLPSDG